MELLVRLGVDSRSSLVKTFRHGGAEDTEKEEGRSGLNWEGMRGLWGWFGVTSGLVWEGEIRTTALFSVT